MKINLKPLYFTIYYRYPIKKVNKKVCSNIVNIPKNIYKALECFPKREFIYKFHHFKYNQHEN